LLALLCVILSVYKPVLVSGARVIEDPAQRDAEKYNEAAGHHAASITLGRHVLEDIEGSGEDEPEGADAQSFGDEEKDEGEHEVQDLQEVHEQDEQEDGEHEDDQVETHATLTRGKPLATQRQAPRNGRARVEHGRWVQTSEGSGKWIFVAKAECPGGVCPATVADENLRSLMELDPLASDQDLYNTVMNSRNWNRMSDRGMRDAACKGHKHEVEFWCKGQAGINGQMAQELDNLEQDWRQKAITRQKAKFAMLEYSRQRRTHEDEHAKALSTISAAKELLAQKRKALLDEEEKVKSMEGKVKEALKASAAQMSAGEEALRQKELEEMVAWQQMQNKRQLVVKFRALNKADIAEMIRQQREEDHEKQRAAKAGHHE